jgi:hypothetical protein
MKAPLRGQRERVIGERSCKTKDGKRWHFVRAERRLDFRAKSLAFL